jgi:hypothetical protein
MEKIIKFKAIDGKEFSSEKECLKYELLIERVNEIMATLPSIPKDDDFDFPNGGGYIQHKKETLRKAQISLLELCKEYIDHHWIQQSIDDENIHTSWVGRLLDDYGIRPLQNAWYRFSCIDHLYREWGQPYFASNPEKGMDTNCINNILDL